MISMTYASYETELCDDNHIYEWETWSAVLEDGLVKLTWRMIEKAPDVMDTIESLIRKSPPDGKPGGQCDGSGV